MSNPRRKARYRRALLRRALENEQFLKEIFAMYKKIVDKDFDD